jgi:phenylacetate-CoA ligase
MIKEFILKNIVFKKRLNLLNKKIRLYKHVKDDIDIVQFQIKKFNLIWEKAYKNISFYKKWKEDYRLPDRITSIEELKGFPILTKNDVRENIDSITDGLEDFYLITTGGTSGITASFPSTKLEDDEIYANGYLGKSWWNINPLDSILMFWGHSHLFGKGRKRYFNKFKRKFNDYMINTIRISSYSLSYKNVKSFYDVILSSNPKVIITYSSNIYKICQYMVANSICYLPKKLKYIILTSETVTGADISLIKRNFKASVILEYGMAETGQIAYSYGDTENIRVFWDSFIVTVDDKSKLYLTTIMNKSFPLINYDSEDLVTTKKEYKGSVLNLLNIKGKTRDVLKVPFNGQSEQEISAIFFDHALKSIPNVFSINYKQEKYGIQIFISSDIDLDLDNLRKIFYDEILNDFPNMKTECIKIVQLNQQFKTIAGKNQIIV